MPRAPASPRLCLAGHDLDRLSDQEALELLLSRRMSASEAKASAERLLGEFGCLRRVLTADPRLLAAHVRPSAALDLRLVYDAARRLAASELPRRSVISSWSSLLAYLKLTMAHLEREAFRVIFLDKRNQLLADEVLGLGTVDHAPVYPREVVRRALELSASALILVHNHPSGDPTPSGADVDMTRKVVEAARALGSLLEELSVRETPGQPSPSPPSALRRPRLPHQVAEAAAAKAARRRHAVIGLAPRHARHMAAEGEAGKRPLRRLAAHFAELRRIEVRQAHLHPSRGQGAGGDAEAVAVPDVGDPAGEAGPGGQPVRRRAAVRDGLARVRERGRGGGEEKRGRCRAEQRTRSHRRS